MTKQPNQFRDKAFEKWVNASKGYGLAFARECWNAAWREAWSDGYNRGLEIEGNPKPDLDTERYEPGIVGIGNQRLQQDEKQRSEISVNEAPITFKDFKDDPLGEGYWYLIKTPTSLDHKYLNICLFLWASFLNTWKPEISKGKQWGSLPMFDRFMRELIPTLTKPVSVSRKHMREIWADGANSPNDHEAWDNFDAGCECALFAAGVKYAD